MARSHRELRLSFDRDTVRLRGSSVHWSWNDAVVWRRGNSERWPERWGGSCRSVEEWQTRQREADIEHYEVNWRSSYFGPDHSLEREEAEQRAQDLLIECLSPSQKEEYISFQCFTVISPSGKPYKIYNSKSYNVESGGIAYCAGPRDEVPIGDMMLSQKLILENDEERFLTIANKQGNSLEQFRIAVENAAVSLGEFAHVIR